MRKVLLTVLALMCAGGLTAQWNLQENLRVTTDGISEADFEARTNKNGVAFVAFWYLIAEDPERLGTRWSDDSDWAYRLQIIDKEGNKRFGDEGLLISDEPSLCGAYGDARTLFIDSDGNALYLVKDQRNASNYEQGFFIYKISPTGQLLWDEPVDLNRGNAYQAIFNSKITQLDDGSYIVAHDIETTNGRMYILIERVSKSGVLLWDEPLILSDNSYTYAFPYLVNSGYNFLLVYSRGGRALGGGTLYAEKFAYDKTPIWDAPVTIYSGGFTSGQTPMTAVQVTPDQKGGCLVSWYDDHTNSGYEKARVSHILSNGTQAFVPSGNDEGLRLNWRTNMRAFRPSTFYDPDGENLYATWEEDNSDQTYRSLVLQKISNGSDFLWTDPDGPAGNINGRIPDSGTAPEGVGYYSLQRAAPGKIALFYQHNYTASGSTENIAVLFDESSGQPEEEQRLVFSQRGRNRTNLTSSPLFDGKYFLTFWNENGAVFAHKVPADLLPPAIPCDPAENIEASVDADSATISWTSDAPKFNVRFCEAGADSWTEHEVAGTTSVTFNGLTPNTAYEYAVQVVCSEAEADTSAYSPVYSFTTPETVVGIALPGTAARAWTVSVSSHILTVLNPAGDLIDRIRIYALDGSLLQDFSVRSSGDVSIPVVLTQKTGIVEVTGKDKKSVFKYELRTKSS
jgi:hypothetical protein